MLVNNLPSKVIVEELVRHGLDYFCIAPGSRSTPLTYEVAKHPKTKDFIHYDERGLGFHALGYGKASKKPAVIIITSGSSLANLFPAVVEAKYSHTPLLILSADRPYELLDSGSNQAIDQVKFFHSYTQWQSDLPLCDEKLPVSSICSTLGYAIAQAKQGPVHLNCHFREPFLEGVKPDCPNFYNNWLSSETPHTTYCSNSSKTDSPIIESLPKNGAIILGRETSLDELDSIIELSKALNYPVFSDILAPRSKQHSDHLITNYEAILKAKPDISFDAILQFGHAYLSKTLLLTLKKSPPKIFHLITSSLKRSDPNHLKSQTHVCSPLEFCKQVRAKNSSLDWIQEWIKYDAQISTFLKSHFNSQTKLTEPSALRHIFQNASDGEIFYIASSMPIRDALSYGHSSTHIELYCNRGASGIDGNLATAFGISQAKDQPITIVIGDIAFLHDLNSLAMIQELKCPPKIIVLNNQGCGVFSFLPIAQKKEVFERYFLTKHPFNFEGAALQYDLKYTKPTNTEEFLERLTSAQENALLVEIQTNTEENLLLHQTLDQGAQDALA